MVKRLFLVVAVALVAVCGTPTSPCACEPERTHILVYGTVRTGTGVPVPSAKVFAGAAPAEAAVYDPVFGEGHEVVTTDAQGKYRVRVLSPFAPTVPATVRVAVVDAPGDTVRSQAVGASLRSERQAADSLEVNVVVP
jgi:hypothetical protein